MENAVEETKDNFDRSSSSMLDICVQEMMCCLAKRAEAVPCSSFHVEDASDIDEFGKEVTVRCNTAMKRLRRRQTDITHSTSESECYEMDACNTSSICLQGQRRTPRIRHVLLNLDGFENDNLDEEHDENDDHGHNEVDLMRPIMSASDCKIGVMTENSIGANDSETAARPEHDRACGPRNNRRRGQRQSTSRNEPRYYGPNLRNGITKHRKLPLLRRERVDARKQRLARLAPEGSRLHGPMKRSKKALLRRQLVARFGRCCQICNRPLAPSEMTLDHIIPRSRGGSNALENLRISCAACNNGRHQDNHFTRINLLDSPVPIIDLDDDLSDKQHGSAMSAAGTNDECTPQKKNLFCTAVVDLCDA